MPDIHSGNRKLFIMKYEHQQLVAKAQIHAKDIKILELNDEIERCKGDMEAQKKLIKEMDDNIKQQKELMIEDEKTAKEDVAKDK